MIKRYFLHMQSAKTRVCSLSIETYRKLQKFRDQDSSGPLRGLSLKFVDKACKIIIRQNKIMSVWGHIGKAFYIRHSM